MSDVIDNSDMSESEKLKEYLKKFSEEVSIPSKHIEYLKKLKEDGFNPKVIYDIGANVLHWTKEATKIFPEAEIILFDACTYTSFFYENHRHFVGVLSNEDNNVVKFYYNNQFPGGNSYYKENNDNYFPSSRFQYFRTFKLDTVVKKYGFPYPDLIKIDVQGAEKDILEGASECLAHTERLIVELQNPDVEYNIGSKKANEMIPFIEELGWNLECKFCPNKNIDADYSFVKKNEVVDKN